MKRLNFKFELGIFVCFFGIVIAELIMEVFHLSFSITSIVFFIGSLLLIDLKKISIMKMVQVKPIFLILIYQIIILLYGFFTNGNMFNGYYPLIYTVFCIFIILILTIFPYTEFNSYVFTQMGWWISGVGSFILLLLFTNGFKQFIFIQELPQGSDRLTLSSFGIGYLLFFLVYKTKKKLECMIQWVFVVSSISNIILCYRKSVVIVYVIILVVHFLKSNKKQSFKKLRNSFFYIIVTAIIILLLLNNIYFYQRLISFFQSIQDAVLGYLGKTKGIYNTGSIRLENLNELWREYNQNYSIVDILIGKGYQYHTIDFPYLQAFTDLGIIMGIYYIVIQLYYPVKYIIMKPISEGHQFIQYYTIMTTLENVFSGTPYGHPRFLPIIFLIFCTMIESKKLSNET